MGTGRRAFLLSTSELSQLLVRQLRRVKLAVKALELAHIHEIPGPKGLQEKPLSANVRHGSMQVGSLTCAAAKLRDMRKANPRPSILELGFAISR